MKDIQSIILEELREFRRETRSACEAMNKRISDERNRVDEKLGEHDRDIVTMRTRWRVLISVVAVGFGTILTAIKDRIFP